MVSCTSSTCSGGVDGGSKASELGIGDAALADNADARRVEFVDAEEVVESSGSSTVSHVCNVASGANETLRFAGMFKSPSV